MQTQVPSHPTPSQLVLFAAGKLDDSQAVAVKRHLDACPGCSQALLQIPPDSLSAKIQVALAGYQPIPTESWAGAVPSALGSIPLTDDSDVSLAIPEELATHSKFRILRTLGRGGMGVVYLAEHRVMERQIAIKVINKALLENTEALQRFHAEVRAAAKLSHPNIVQAFDAEQSGDMHFLVMEYVEGRNLAEWVEKRQKALPIKHACSYVLQTARGLQHAFERNMVHRDIKPQNLMLTPKGQIKILDFGLARMVRERSAQAPGLTSDHAFMGTPEYVAPEQAADARQADIRADLYSLGCTLYFLLTGRPPFRGETAIKVVLAHVQDTPTPLTDIRSDVPAQLGQIVQRMLAKDARDRFQEPKDFIAVMAPLARSVSSAQPAKKVDSQENARSRVTVVKSETSRIIHSHQSPPDQPWAGLDAGQDDQERAAEPNVKAPFKRPAIYLLLILVLSCAAASIVIWQPNLEPGSHQSANKDELARSQAETPAPQVSRAEEPPPLPVDRGDFIRLMNDSDMNGWSLEGPHKTEIAVTDGTLSAHNSGPRGWVDHLVTNKADFRDFHLRFKFRSLEDDHAPPTVIVRIDNSPISFGGMRGYGISLGGASGAMPEDRGRTTFLNLDSRARASRELTKSINHKVSFSEWNTCDIITTGYRIQVYVNSKRVIDYEDEGRVFRSGAIALRFRPNTTNYYKDFQIRNLQLETHGDVAALNRTRWVYQKVEGNEFNETWDVFQKVGDKKWIESVTDLGNRFSRFTFTEIDRTEDYVELVRPDGTATMHIRLFENRGAIGSSRDNLRNWRNGSWVSAPQD